jgi:dTMP kinase
MLIALEGIDASGKNTHSNKLQKHYNAIGRQAELLSFPHYNSITGQIIRGHLAGDWSISLAETHTPASYTTDPGTYLFQCAQVANRLEMLPDAVWDDEGQIFIADRYNASAYAYGLALNLDFEWLLKLHRNMPQPDVNIFLDISVEESFKRRPERRDNYEKNSVLLNRVRSCYLDVFKRLGSTYVVIDASGSTEQTFAKILDAIK